MQEVPVDSWPPRRLQQPSGRLRSSPLASALWGPDTAAERPLSRPQRLHWASLLNVMQWNEPEDSDPPFDADATVRSHGWPSCHVVF